MIFSWLRGLWPKPKALTVIVDYRFGGWHVKVPWVLFILRDESKAGNVKE